MSSKVAIINVNLEYEFPKETTEEEIKTFLHNVELPKFLVIIHPPIKTNPGAGKFIS